MPSSENQYWLEDGVNFLVWVDRTNPKIVHLTTNDARLVLPGGGGGRGLHLVENDYPKSANFRPITVAKVLHALREQGMRDLPSHGEVFMADRHLSKRDEVIEQYETFIEEHEEVAYSFDVPASRAEELRQRLDALSEEFEGFVWEQADEDRRVR